jgi:uncharacterized membrane-anchored protein
LGDLLDKPLAAGGLDLSRFSASAALFAFILATLLIFPPKPARQVH